MGQGLLQALIAGELSMILWGPPGQGDQHPDPGDVYGISGTR